MGHVIQLPDVDAAANVLRNWGFVSHADMPNGPGASWLAIAIRPSPTLTHFDPELIRYWITHAGRGVAREIDHKTALPLAAEFSWGPIRAIDRLNVINEWVGFGGTCTAAEVDGSRICVFRSEAPILRRGGHSQGWDHGAASLAAFFGRIKVAVDYLPGFEARVAAATARVRFAAFVMDLAGRYRAAPILSAVHPDLWTLIRAEEGRLRSAEPAVWEAGLELAAAAGLVDIP